MAMLVNILSSSKELLLVIVNTLLSSASDREKSIPLLSPSVKPCHWKTSPLICSPVYVAVILSVAPYKTVELELSSYLTSGFTEEHEVNTDAEAVIVPLIEAIITGVIIFFISEFIFHNLLLIISIMVHVVKTVCM
jgi:hypothetical protein